MDDFLKNTVTLEQVVSALDCAVNEVGAKASGNPSPFDVALGTTRHTFESLRALVSARREEQKERTALRPPDGLRDTFAAAALSALIAKYDGQDGSIDSIPQGAYEYADAMLAAREGK